MSTVTNNVIVHEVLAAQTIDQLQEVARIYGTAEPMLGLEIDGDALAYVRRGIRPRVEPVAVAPPGSCPCSSDCPHPDAPPAPSRHFAIGHL
tara:strand:- start:585 stop:860 length:276 start_codon:yes stop_codon:yes gene_type:complete